MSDQVAIKTWGNSQGIRIPKNILEKLGLHVSDTLQIEVIDDYWGEPVGKEIL